MGVRPGWGRILVPRLLLVLYRSRGMTSPDPEIDGGLPWIRGVDPAAGSTLGSTLGSTGSTQDPPGSRGGSDPATNLGTDSTEEKRALEPTSRKRNPLRNRLQPTSRQRNPAAFQKCYVDSCRAPRKESLPERDFHATLRFMLVAQRHVPISGSSVCLFR